MLIGEMQVTSKQMYVVRHLPSMPVKRTHVIPEGRPGYAQRIENVRRDDAALTQLIVYTDNLADAFVYTSVEQAQFDVDRYGLGEIVALADLLNDMQVI